MSWDRNNLATHAPPSILRDSLSSSSAGLNLVRHLGQFGMFPVVAGKGPNTSIILKPQQFLETANTEETLMPNVESRWNEEMFGDRFCCDCFLNILLW